MVTSGLRRPRGSTTRSSKLYRRRLVTTVMSVGAALSTGFKNNRFARRLGVICQPRLSPIETFSIFSPAANSKVVA